MSTGIPALRTAPSGVAPARGVVRAIGGFISDHQAVIYAFTASRAALLMVGLLTEILIQPIAADTNPLHLSPHAALSIWGRWDTGWYLGIAAQGYSAAAGPDGQANWAFFPAFPLLSAGLAGLTRLPVFVAMLAVSNASFLAALALVHRLARAEFDRRTADVAVAIICTFPGSYIFSSAYTESLFLFATTAALLALRDRRWVAAGAFGALAVLTRNLGVGLVLPFAVAAGPRLWTLGREARAGAPLAGMRLRREGVRVAAGVGLMAAALGGFCLLLYRTTGDPLAFVTIQNAWGRSVGLPLAKPMIHLLKPATLGDSDVLSLAWAWVSLGLLAVLAAMRRWMLLSLAAFLVLAPLATGVGSYARYALVIAPLFLAAARLLAPRPTAALSLLIFLATLNGFMMVAWTLALWISA